MKVLVTGATGFVGRHVVAQLLARGHQVIAVARDEARARNFAWYERVRFIVSDIHGPIEDAFERFDRPQAVMHLAWPGLPNYAALYHYEKTLPADYHFLRSLVLGGLGHLLVSGTCVEYGMQGGALAEDMPAAPLASPYAKAKDALRKKLQTLQGQHPFKLQWARLFYMYGEGQNPNSLLAQLDRAIDAGETTFNMSGGEQLRDYLPVEQVAAHCVTLLEHPGCSGVFNICSGEPISVRALAERHLARRGAGIRLNFGYYPYASDEPMAFWGDPGRLRTVLQST